MRSARGAVLMRRVRKERTNTPSFQFVDKSASTVKDFYIILVFFFVSFLTKITEIALMIIE